MSVARVAVFPPAQMILGLEVAGAPDDQMMLGLYSEWIRFSDALTLALLDVCKFLAAHMRAPFLNDAVLSQRWELSCIVNF